MKILLQCKIIYLPKTTKSPLQFGTNIYRTLTDFQINKMENSIFTTFRADFIFDGLKSFFYIHISTEKKYVLGLYRTSRLVRKSGKFLEFELSGKRMVSFLDAELLTLVK